MPKREPETSVSASRAAPPKVCAEASAHAAMPNQPSAYISGAPISKARPGHDNRRSSRPHSASRPTLTSPVREAVSTTANSIAASSGSAQRQCSRRNSSRATTAIADHSSRLLRWLGWRRLPTARPTMPERAIQSPSGHCGAKTCTNAMPTLKTPAATQPAQNITNIGAAPRCAAPPATSSIAAASIATADSARLAGSPPKPQEPAAASSTSSSAACKGVAPPHAPPGRPDGVDTAPAATKPPHSAQANAWFRKVGDGETLYASSEGALAAAMAKNLGNLGVRSLI